MCSLKKSLRQNRRIHFELPRSAQHDAVMIESRPGHPKENRVGGDLQLFAGFHGKCSSCLERIEIADEPAPRQAGHTENAHGIDEAQSLGPHPVAGIETLTA